MIISFFSISFHLRLWQRNSFENSIEYQSLVAGDDVEVGEDAPDGALDEGAIDISFVIILKAVDLAGSQAIGELQFMGGSIDDGQHATA